MRDKIWDGIIVLCVFLNFGIAIFNVTWSRPEPPKTVTQEIQELANEWQPNWRDPHEIKYYIAYDHFSGYPVIRETNTKEIYGVSYFETASQAGEAMLYLGDKLRVLK